MVTNDATSEIAAEASDGARGGAIAGVGGGSRRWTRTNHPPNPRPATPCASQRIRHRPQHHCLLYYPRRAYRGMSSF